MQRLKYASILQRRMVIVSGEINVNLGTVVGKLSLTQTRSSLLQPLQRERGSMAVGNRKALKGNHTV